MKLHVAIKYKIFTLIIALLVGSNSILSQEANKTDDLAQQLQNPLATLTIIPVLHAFYLESTQTEEVGYTSTLQPMFPINFNKVNMINRVVFGIGYQPGIVEGLDLIPQGYPEKGQIDGAWGISDLNYSFFISPKNVRKVAWGVGPSVTFPTSTDNRLGTGKYSLGFSFVVVYQYEKLTMDLIVRQTWSVAGDAERRDVNQLVAQPLIAYALGKGWVLSTYPTISANWSFDEDRQWTVPIGAGVSKLLFLGKLPMNLSAQYYHYVVRPDLAPHSEFRITTTFVLAK